MKNSIIYLGFIFVALLMSCNGGDPGFANPTPEARDCEATNARVNQTRSLSISPAYGISGEVTIVSDCQIEVSNFFYDGTGPAVSFYGAADGDFRSGVNMSEVLNGRTWEGETLNLYLPEGTTFDDINSFSVWCYEFDVNFSSAFFE